MHSPETPFPVLAQAWNLEHMELGAWMERTGWGPQSHSCWHLCHTHGSINRKYG